MVLVYVQVVNEGVGGGVLEELDVHSEVDSDQTVKMVGGIRCVMDTWIRD